MKEKKLDEGQKAYINKFKSRFGTNSKAWPFWIPKHHDIHQITTKINKLKKRIIEGYRFECPHCGGSLTKSQYDQLEEDDAYRTLTNEEWKQCPSCKERVHFKERVIKTKLGQRREIERSYEKDKRKDMIRLSDNEVRKFFRACEKRDKEFVPVAEKMTQGRRFTGEETEVLKEKEKPYLKEIYKSIGMNICAAPGCFEIFRGRSNKEYCSENCRLRAKQRRYRVKVNR